MVSTHTEDFVVSLSPESEILGAGNHFEEFFSTPSRHGLLQQLLHLIRFGEGLPVIHGGQGAGKSAIARELKSQLNDAGYVAGFACSEEMSLVDLLVRIAAGFSIEMLETAKAGEVLVELRRFSEALVQGKQLAVLVLDDAHFLDEQELGAALSLLQGANSPGFGLHMVFVSEPGLVARIDEFGLLEIPVYDFEIPLFSPSELSAFLKKTLGASAAKSLTAGDVQGVWAQSLGSPGTALKLISKNYALENSTEAGAASALMNMPKGHLLALLLLCVVLVWAVMSRDNGSGEDNENSAPGKIVELERKVTDELVNVPQADLVPLPEPRSVPPKVEPAIQKIEPAIQKAVQAETPIVKAPPAGEPSPEEKGSPSLPKSLSSDELFLMDQSPESFTLQIIAASRKEALEEYISQQANRSDLFLYRGLREGKSWYVVVTGVYGSRQQAQSAIEKLPLKQKNAGPWPRKLETIQKELAANRSN